MAGERDDVHHCTRAAESRLRRHRRVRKKIHGTAARPRLAVHRSNKHLVAQVIDDDTGRTLAAASTIEADFRGDGGHSVAAASKVGALVAERAKAAGVTQVVFDRGGYIYHGRIAAVAAATRRRRSGVLMVSNDYSSSNSQGGVDAGLRESRVITINRVAKVVTRRPALLVHGPRRHR